MAREFTDADGKQWTAFEAGTYYGIGIAPDGGVLPETSIADITFRSAAGQRVTGHMRRGAVDRAPEDELRQALRDALRDGSEVE